MYDDRPAIDPPQHCAAEQLRVTAAIECANKAKCDRGISEAVSSGARDLVEIPCFDKNRVVGSL